MKLFLGGPALLGRYGENLTVEMRSKDGRPHLLLHLVLVGASVRERSVLSRGPLSLALLSSPPLAWVVLSGPGMAFDGPFAIGVEDAKLVATLRSVLRDEAVLVGRGHALLELVCIEAIGGIIFQTHRFRISGRWTAALAKAVQACPDRLDPQSRVAAIARDYGRWPRPSTMFAAATEVETILPIAESLRQESGLSAGS